MTEVQGAPSYSGDENPSGLPLPSAVQALVDNQFDSLARVLADALSLNTAIRQHQDAYLYRLLSTSMDLCHEAEKLTALLVACARKLGWPDRAVAAAMGRTTSELSTWTTAEAQAMATAAAGEELGDDWNVATAEAHLGAQWAVENADRARKRAYRLMCLLMLHDTPSYAADGLTWVDEKTRRCIKNGWSLQARRTATKTAEPSASTKEPDAAVDAEIA